MNRGVRTAPSVKLLPVSSFRSGLPADVMSVVCVLAIQLWNGLPTGVLAVIHGDPGSTVVGTPAAAQLAAKFGLSPMLN